MKRGYPENQALSAAANLMDLDSSLQRIFQEWLEDEKKEQDWVVQGFSLLTLKNKFCMTYPAALLTMDWLIKEPEKAEISINRGIR